MRNNVEEQTDGMFVCAGVCFSFSIRQTASVEDSCVLTEFLSHVDTLTNSAVNVSHTYAPLRLQLQTGGEATGEKKKE